MMDKLIDAALAAKVDGHQFIKQIDVLVWANQEDFPGVSDCGGLAKELKSHFMGKSHVRIHNVTKGDLFCSILNYGVLKQIRAGCDYSLIASAEANPYWNSDIPEMMIQAICDGALAVGVAINELTQSVLEGRIANTLAMWENTSLMMVGGFDLGAAKPKDDRHAHYMKGVDTDGNTRFYHLGGVEEMVPLARLVDTFGPCIAPIQSNNSTLRYIMPDPRKDLELFERHMSKFGTKTERQTAHLVRINRDVSHIKGGVMDGYGWKK